MRNSIVPLVAVAGLIAVGLFLIRPTVERGQGGPIVNAGILRLPKRDPLRTGTAELVGSTAARLESGARDDGLWRVVVVAGDDREPTTRAAMLALGEQLFAAGMVPLMDPAPTASEPVPPLPLPADRVVRIATRAAAIGSAPDGAWSATVVFAVGEPRLPDNHPGAGLLPPPQVGPAVVVVDHDGRVAAGAAPTWPERWAATGRAIVSAALGTLLPPSGLSRPSSHLVVDWGSPVPFAPQTGEVRWSGCFQHDAARGWVGRIAGRQVATSSGGLEAADQPLVRLLKRGEWQPVEAIGPWRQWSRLRDGHQQWFAVRDDGDGWTTTMWSERPDLVGVVDAWLAAARGGDAQAREHLRRLAAAPGLPQAVRARLP